VNYYSELFRKPADELADHTNCKENFLGPAICEHPLVLNSKLSEEEKTELDLPLTIDELDKSLEKANFRSASGVDGLSNLFLRQYWRFFRTVVHRYATHCFDRGRLTDNFRGATIKPIPKKGDPASLGNWRPILLLSNVYKILSSTLNIRLNKIVNRICRRA